MNRILAALVAVALATLGALAMPSAALANGTVSGTITNGSSVGIPGAVIEFRYSGSVNYYYGDANGNYTADVPVHDYTVYIHAPGYAPEYYNDSFSGSGAAVVSVTEGGNLTLNATLSAASSISGTVTSYSNAPVAAQVFATGAGDLFGKFFFASTDPATGAYTIGDLAPGSYTLYISSSDTDDLVNEFYNDATTRETATPVVISTPGSTATANVQLAQGGILQGSVVNTIGSPITNLWVTLVDDPYREYEGGLDNNGDYVIHGVRTGTHTAEIKGSGFFADQTSGPFTITTTTPSTANFVLTPSFPDESEFVEKEPVSGPTSVTAGKTYTWTVEPGANSDVYAILYSDPVFLGAAVQDNNEATLTLTIPADTPAGAHKLTYSSYDLEMGYDERYYFDLDVAAAALPGSGTGGTKLASTGADATPYLLGAAVLLLLGAALVGTRRLAR